MSAISAFSILACFSAWRLIAVSGSAFPWICAGAALLGWVATDLLSGLAHWVFDSWGSPSTKFLGAAFIRPFREHHEDPLAMTTHDFVETNGSSCLGCLPLLVAASTMSMPSRPWVLLQAFLLFTSLGLMLANQCHKWAHLDEAAAAAPVRWAQRLGLVLDPEHHRQHHTPPFSSHFCTASGWMNRPLNFVLCSWR
ncbi:MAG: fatty acid desaturase CarF family protein [Thermoanaerobaculia bacterium]